MGTPVAFMTGSAFGGAATQTAWMETGSGGSGVASPGSFTTLEVQRQLLSPDSGTYSGLYANVATYGTSGGIPFTFRIGAANGNEAVSITAIGEYLDSTHTDAVTGASSLINTQVVQGAGGTITGNLSGMVFTPSANTTIQTWCKDGFNDYSGAQSYDTVSGQSGSQNTTEANAQHKMQIAGTLANLNAYIDTFSSVTATVTSRVGAAAGNQSLAPSGLGQIADTTHTDSVVAGNLVNTYTHITAGTSTNFGTTFVMMDLASTLATQYVSGYGLTGGGIGIFSANTTEYAAITTRLRFGATESQFSCKTGTTFTASSLQGYVGVNTITGNTVVTFRVGGAGGNNTITFGSGATGWVADSTHTDSVSPTTEIDHQVVTPNSGTSINFTNLSFTATYPATATLFRRTIYDRAGSRSAA